jgi:hypothetical protein
MTPSCRHARKSGHPSLLSRQNKMDARYGGRDGMETSRSLVGFSGAHKCHEAGHRLFRKMAPQHCHIKDL